MFQECFFNPSIDPRNNSRKHGLVEQQVYWSEIQECGWGVTYRNTGDSKTGLSLKHPPQLEGQFWSTASLQLPVSPASRSACQRVSSVSWSAMQCGKKCGLWEGTWLLWVWLGWASFGQGLTLERISLWPSSAWSPPFQRTQQQGSTTEAYSWLLADTKPVGSLILLSQHAERWEVHFPFLK